MSTPHDGPSPGGATPAVQPLPSQQDQFTPSEQSRPSQQPATSLVPLQPLPRGRPPQPKDSGPPPGSRRPDDSQEWENYANAAPNTQQQAQEQEQQQQRQQQQQSHSRKFKKSSLEPAYTRGGHLLGGYNAARYPGISNTHANFSRAGKVLHLTGPNNIHAWTEQVTYIATVLSCFDELTKRFTSFPNPCSVQLFICETRHATAFRVLEASISGPVWAYMRVLGYSSLAARDGLMSPAPVDCFEYARMAASMMLIPGTRKQPVEERERMVQEILNAESRDYPSERGFKKGIDWLRLACDNLIKQGDYKLAVSLYDPVPDWASRAAEAEHDEPTISTAMPGEAVSATCPERSEAEATLGASGIVPPSDEAVISPTANGSNDTPTMQQNPASTSAPEQSMNNPVATEEAGVPAANHTPVSPSLASDNVTTQSTKRKRSNEDEDSVRERSQPSIKTEP